MSKLIYHITKWCTNMASCWIGFFVLCLTAVALIAKSVFMCLVSVILSFWIWIKIYESRILDSTIIVCLIYILYELSKRN